MTAMTKFRDKADAELVNLKKALEEVAQRFEEVSCKGALVRSNSAMRFLRGLQADACRFSQVCVRRG